MFEEKCTVCRGTGRLRDGYGHIHNCDNCGGAGEYRPNFITSLISWVLGLAILLLFITAIVVWLIKLVIKAFYAVLDHWQGFINYIGTSLSVNNILAYIIFFLIFTTKLDTHELNP